MIGLSSPIGYQATMPFGALLRGSVENAIRILLIPTAEKNNNPSRFASLKAVRISRFSRTILLTDQTRCRGHSSTDVSSNPSVSDRNSRSSSGTAMPSVVSARSSVSGFAGSKKRTLGVIPSKNSRHIGTSLSRCRPFYNQVLHRQMTLTIT